MFTGLGKLSSHFNPNLKISPEFLRGFSFHLQPKFPRGFPPPTTKIPGDSPWKPRDFARWADLPTLTHSEWHSRVNYKICLTGK